MFYPHVYASGCYQRMHQLMRHITGLRSSGAILQCYIVLHHVQFCICYLLIYLILSPVRMPRVLCLLWVAWVEPARGTLSYRCAPPDLRVRFALFLAMPPPFSASLCFLQVIPFCSAQFSLRLIPAGCSRVLVLIILVCYGCSRPCLRWVGRRCPRSFERSCSRPCLCWVGRRCLRGNISKIHKCKNIDFFL